MGQCGCGDMNPQWQLQGPGTTTYVIEIYAGCPDCETPAGIAVHRMSPSDMDAWDLHELPELPFRRVGHEELDAPIQLVHPKVLMLLLNKEGQGFEPVGIAPRDASLLLREAVNRTRTHYDLTERSSRGTTEG